MKPSESDLVLLFDGLSDDELLSRCTSGTLTEEAQIIALAEARRRGLTPVEPEPVVVDDEAYYGDFVIVVRDLNLSEAQIYKALLEAAGIPAEVGNANFSRAYVSLYSANVKVPAAFVSEANGVFTAFRRGVFSLDDDVDPKLT
jgi:hypothetical protein